MKAVHHRDSGLPGPPPDPDPVPDLRADDRDPWPARLGFAAMMAFGVPLLGAELGEYTGVHPRALSYACIAFVLIGTLAGRYGAGVVSRLAGSVHIALVVFGLAVLVALPLDQDLWVLGGSMQLETYAGFKFTRVVLIAIPTILTGIAAYPLARRPAFTRGVVVATLVLAGLATLELLAYQHLLTSGNRSDWSAFADESGFSTISMSMVFLFALIGAQARAIREGSKSAVITAVVVSGWCLFASFLLAQRTTMGLGVLFTGITALRLVRHQAAARLVWLAIAAGALLTISGFGADDTSGSLEQYATQLARVESLLSGGDNSTNSRLEMWQFTFDRTLANPLGHGFGSFPHYNRDQFYPHNTLAEAGFELGLMGVASVASMLLISASLSWRLLRSGATVYFFSLVAAVMWVMKAGDFSGLGNWLFWLYLGIGALLRRPGSAR